MAGRKPKSTAIKKLEGNVSYCASKEALFRLIKKRDCRMAIAPLPIVILISDTKCSTKRNGLFSVLKPEVFRHMPLLKRCHLY